ncbi:MAG TPA: isoleucine--tRNA ligase, partial [Acidimicrobiia bacterium]|nr:isoleucine--tRNA ligase [Acidimicrobiia bacterium]
MNSKSNSNASLYPKVTSSPDLPKIEEEILELWEKNKTFQASVDGKKNDSTDEIDNGEYVFYDGPPFANGLPHYGHLITGFVKDTVPRYQTMKGKRVARRFGWDCHGLPAEMQAEKETGISGRMAVTEYGIDKFNDACKTSVLRFTNEWRQYVTRQARWVDFDNDYKTLDIDYMESVIWAFKTLYDKGLIYEGLRVLPYSWAAETVLSNHETKLDDSYRERDDPALTIAFKVKDLADKAALALDSILGDMELNIVAWTTTPWTLPSNLALAVGAEVQYVVLELDSKLYLLSESAIEKYEKEFEGATQIATLPGDSLEGTTYEPLFPYFADIEGGFQVHCADFVSTEDGTGVVHLAPYGEDDFELLSAKGIEIPVAVDAQGKFDSRIPDYEGQLVFDANSQIAKDLKAQGKVIRHATYRHPYPHCWRTDEPLIYRPMSSWFVKVTDIKDRMLELNKEINWIPEHVKDGAFGMWLEGARDWSISRNRFWGSPIPVWQSDDPNYPRIDVYGSLEEIEKDFGRRPTDLHRPEIDGFTRPNPDDPTGKSTMRRVEEVFDCWFESGSMPYAQAHYPFENKEWFEGHFPGDFIVEYIAQSRGWFYTMHVLATALFDKPAFKTCMAHGNILGADGRKMSKRLKNYPDPLDVYANYGSDAMRWALQSSPVLRGQDLIVGEDVFATATRNAILPLWNSYYFFTLYANSDGLQGKFITESDSVLDNYMLAKTRSFIEDLTKSMDEIDLFAASAQFETHLDVLTNWFIRRSRERFWRHEHDEDKVNAYNTLYTVLELTSRAVAPLLPLVSENIWRGLHASEVADNDQLSVHLSNWPLADTQKLPNDRELIDSMDMAREICSNALAIRRSNDLRTRLPLAKLIVAGPNAKIALRFSDVIKDEVNVKEVVFQEDASSFGKQKLNLVPAV